MRRQARKSVSGALIVRSASALQVWLWLLLFVFQNEFRISWSIKPGYLDYDNLPETNFTCTGKVIGGYYADLETSCQMFHVCTIGQQNEPMDIKFLCLNGTVFDQETRVCERVDEVDCTKSEKFYSLNLELYGSTVPPIVPPEPEKPQAPDTEQAQKTNNSNTHILTVYVNDNPTTPDKTQKQQSDTIDSTEDPIQDYKKEEPKNISNQNILLSKDEDELNEEYEEEDEEAIDNENTGFEEDYSQPFTTTTIQIITSTTTTTKKPTTSSTTIKPPSSNLPYLPPLITTPSPLPPSFAPSISPSSTIDPSLLSPQEFIYRHRGPGSEAISFQRQSFRPADGVYITHAPPQQFDHFQYESSRTAPRPVVSHPAPFQRPSPSPFRATTIDPSDQILRPVANSQSSERHETTIKHRPQNYPAHLPAQPPLPFNPFYYDRKRSDDILPDDKSSLSARSVAPPTETERPPIKLKSPPRVIVTASASVSDSNGKRLNYTVGNVVSAVKPIVPINYDDYKESDLLFDPFFLDVPKLHPRRKTRSSSSKKIITVPALTAKPLSFKSEKIVTTLPPQTSQATTAKASSFTQSPTTTVGWNPHDYVDDNYEPHSYNMQPVPPLAVLLNHDYTQPRKPDKPVKNVASDKELKSSHIIKQLKSTSLEAQKKSSQNVGTEVAVPVTSPTPYGAPTCVTSHSTDCPTRA